MKTWGSWLALLLSVVPLAAGGAEVEVAVRSGNQSQPAVSGTLAAFTDASGDFPQVWTYDLATGASAAIAPLAAAQGSPTVAGSAIAYVDSRTHHPEIWIWTAANGAVPTVTYPPYVPGPPAASGRVLAWADTTSKPARLWVLDFNSGQMLSVGNTTADAVIGVSGPLVVYTGEDGNSVMLYDADTTATPTMLTAGPAASPHVDGNQVAFVDLSTDAEGDLAVVSTDGTPLASLPLQGAQQHPRISGDWVAFEDMGTGGRLAIWNWQTGKVYYPAPAGTTQTESDLSYPWVVYTDQRNGDDDVYAQKLDLETPDGGPGGQVSCDDASVVPMATLTATVAEQKKPPHKKHCHSEPGDGGNDGDGDDDDTYGWGVGHVEFDSASAVPVLFCIDGAGQQKGFVTLDALLLAGPRELGPGVSHLEAQGVACAGKNWVETGLTGPTGSTLTVRVLANPGADGGSACACDGGKDCGACDHGGGCGGCASGGGAGILALLGGGIHLLRRRRR